MSTPFFPVARDTPDEYSLQSPSNGRENSSIFLERSGDAPSDGTAAGAVGAAAATLIPLPSPTWTAARSSSSVEHVSWRGKRELSVACLSSLEARSSASVSLQEKAWTLSSLPCAAAGKAGHPSAKEAAASASTQQPLRRQSRPRWSRGNAMSDATAATTPASNAANVVRNRMPSGASEEALASPWNSIHRTAGAQSVVSILSATVSGERGGPGSDGAMVQFHNPEDAHGTVNPLEKRNDKMSASVCMRDSGQLSSGGGGGVAALWNSGRNKSLGFKSRLSTRDEPVVDSDAAVTTTTSMTAMVFSAASPDNLPPDESKTSGGSLDPVSSPPSLSVQRAMAERGGIFPIQLEEELCFTSCMSLSSTSQRHSRVHSAPNVHNFIASPSTESSAVLTNFDVRAELSDVAQSMQTPRHFDDPLTAVDAKPAREDTAPYPTQRKSISFPPYQDHTNSITRAPSPTVQNTGETRSANFLASTCIPENHEWERPQLPRVVGSLPLDTYAALQMSEFESRAAVEKTETKAREKILAREVSLYLWHARNERAVVKIAHKPTHTIPSLEKEEEQLLSRHILNRAAVLAKEHADAMLAISRSVPATQDTTLSHLSDENMPGLFTFGAGGEGHLRFPTVLPQEYAPAVSEATTRNLQQTTLSGGGRGGVKLAPRSPADPEIDAEVARQLSVKRFLNRSAPLGGTYFSDLGL